jgi:hypothetical protein
MSLKKDIQKVEDQLVQEIKHTERWIIERKRFFIKLFWVFGFIAFLLILLNFL